MATLPSAKDLGVSEVRPNLGIATYSGATGQEGDAARMVAFAGGQFDEAAQYFLRAREDYAKTEAEDKYNQYQEVLLKSRMDGWSQVRGGNAVNPEFQQKTIKGFDEERSKIETAISDPLTKRRFQQLAQIATLNHRAHLMEHVAKERDAYETDVYKSGRAVEMQNIAGTFAPDDANNIRFESSVARMNDLTKAYAISRGLTGDAVKAAQQQDLDQAVEARVIAAATGKDPFSAQKIYDAYKDRLSTKSRQELTDKLKQAIDPQVAIRDAAPVVDRFLQGFTPTTTSPAVVSLSVDGKKTKGTYDQAAIQAIANDMQANGQSASNVNLNVQGRNIAGTVYLENGQPRFVPDTKVKPADIRAKFNELDKMARAEAQKLRPGDFRFEQTLVSQVFSRVNTVLATGEAEEKQAHEAVFSKALGRDGQAPTSLAQLQSDPATANAISKLDASSYNGLVVLLKQNADEQGGRKGTSDPVVLSDVWRRIHQLPDGDPNKITSPSQLPQFFAINGKPGLNRMDYEWLQKEVTEAQNPEGKPLLQEKNQVFLLAQKAIDQYASQFQWSITQPGVAGEVWREYVQDVNEKIETQRKAGKNPMELFDYKSKDYVFTAETLQKYLQRAQQKGQVKADAQPPMPSPDQMPMAKSLEQLKSMTPQYVRVEDGKDSRVVYWTGQRITEVTQPAAPAEPAKPAKPANTEPVYVGSAVDAARRGGMSEKAWKEREQRMAAVNENIIQTIKGVPGSVIDAYAPKGVSRADGLAKSFRQIVSSGSYKQEWLPAIRMALNEGSLTDSEKALARKMLADAEK